MEFTLYPSWVVISYHSTFGRHKMTLPTRQWSSALGTFGNGGYVAWDDSVRDADAMIQDMAGEIVPLMPTAVDFDDYVIYNQPNPDEPVAFQVATGSIALSGLDSTPGWLAGVQQTHTYYDDGFFPGKVVLLDAASNNDFSKIPYGSASDPQKAVLLQFGLATNAWASRAGRQATNPRNILTTLNNKLRKQYGLT